ncbi:hypothetical protein DFH06DRAFT_718019 [Mycena polygramma]|nr:hypothetical protein DFH06DRAFT_718019 [Mycena polygramma]
MPVFDLRLHDPRSLPFARRPARISSPASLQFGGCTGNCWWVPFGSREGSALATSGGSLPEGDRDTSSLHMWSGSFVSFLLLIAYAMHPVIPGISLHRVLVTLPPNCKLTSIMQAPDKRQQIDAVAAVPRTRRKYLTCGQRYLSCVNLLPGAAVETRIYLVAVEIFVDFLRRPVSGNSGA